jgi:hypothetical protein
MHPLGSDTDSVPRDHSDCPSAQALRELRREQKVMAEDVSAMRRVLLESSPDRGSVLDEQRKHAAQIKELQGSTWTVFIARAFLQSAIGLGTALIFALVAKGLLLEFLAQAQKLAHP